MEEKESFGSGLVLKDNDAQDSFHVASRNENSGPVSAPATVTGTQTPGTNVKKKRGRPRKYAPDGSMALALSPMPISSILLSGDFSGWKWGRGRLRTCYYL
ncbi:hypothetical protein K1719_045675 [Acacia pycnantha]|nr:hypothetical protein K1719_045675 [Acacia pycnantha]